VKTTNFSRSHPKNIFAVAELQGDKGSTEPPTLGRHGSLAAANSRGQQRLEPLEIMELSDFNLFNDNSWTLEILHTPKTILKKTELQQHFHLHKWM
jgi:hypothetical protein